MGDIDELGVESSIQQWFDAVAAPSATPAGGSAAALATALAASLVTMVAGMTTRREKYAAVHGHAQEVRERADTLRAELLELAAQDKLTQARAVKFFERVAELIHSDAVLDADVATLSI
jgi:formiminotetrahydrofolate cyclodeaminase